MAYVATGYWVSGYAEGDAGAGITGVSAATLAAITGSAAGTVGYDIHGASAATLAAIGGSAAGAVAIVGASAVTLDAITGVSASSIPPIYFDPLYQVTTGVATSRLGRAAVTPPAGHLG
jgi:hypothetical protein